MVTVNCGAIPENLLEAEFFGHVKGAFTGAVGARMGRFEQAHGSTLFLDEIGDMPVELQSKVLRAVQEREFQRVGSSQTVQVDVRVIAATHADLVERVRLKEFREDLYYRLNVVPIAIPPLADRLDDVPALVEHFLDKICLAEDLPRRRIGHETVVRLMQYHWPGNVRQLENAVEKAVVLSGERQELFPSDFLLPASQPKVDPALVAGFDLPPGGLDLDALLSGIELTLLQQALERAGGNKNRAAQMLGLKRTTLSAKLKSM
jgi:transcriptional regulator with GAF, ATPase, and Fis domain